MLLRTLERWAQADWHKDGFVKGLYVSYALFIFAFTGIIQLHPSYDLSYVLVCAVIF